MPSRRCEVRYKLAWPQNCAKQSKHAGWFAPACGLGRHQSNAPNLLQHPNPIEKAKHRKHISDIIKLAHTLRAGDEIAVPSEIAPSLQKIIEKPEDYFLPQRIRDSLWADNPDLNVRRAIKSYTPETFSDILKTYFKIGQQPADLLT